jgi:hypothetical protein
VKVAYDNFRLTCARWHGMAIDQQRIPEASSQGSQLNCQQAMIWTVNFIKAPVELRPPDSSAPKTSMAMRPGRYEA